MSLRKKLKNWLKDDGIDVPSFMLYLSDQGVSLDEESVVAWEEVGEYIEDFKSLKNEYIEENEEY